MRGSRPLNLLILSNIISGLAQGISMLAVPWYFVSILKAPQSLALMYMLMLVGSVPWNIYGGTLIDKYPRKKIFLIFTLFGGIILCSASLSGLFYPTGVPTYMVIIAFLGTCYYNGVYYPALYAFAQEVTEPGKYGKVNSVLEIQSQATTILSGGIAALLIQGYHADAIHIGSLTIPIAVHIKAWSMSRIFFVDGITYFIAIALIALVKYTPHTDTHKEEGSIWERFNTGFSFLRTHRPILLFGVTSLSVFVFLLLHFNTLVPVFVVNHLHRTVIVYSLTDVFYAAGALLAGVGIRKLFRGINTVLAVLILTGITWVTLTICALSTSVIIYFAFTFILGITNAGSRIMRITYLFHHVPNKLIGRVNSTLFMVGTVCRILLAMIVSLNFFSEGDNVVWALLICVVYLLINFVWLGLDYKKLLGRYPDPDVKPV